MYAQKHDSGGPKKESIDCCQWNAFDINPKLNLANDKNEHWNQCAGDGEGADDRSFGLVGGLHNEGSLTR